MLLLLYKMLAELLGEGLLGDKIHRGSIDAFQLKMILPCMGKRAQSILLQSIADGERMADLTTRLPQGFGIGLAAQGDRANRATVFGRLSIPDQHTHAAIGV